MNFCTIFNFFEIHLYIYIWTTHPDDLALFEGQLFVGGIGVGGHGEWVVVEQRHEDPEGLLGLGVAVVRRGTSLPLPVAPVFNTASRHKHQDFITPPFP